MPRIHNKVTSVLVAVVLTGLSLLVSPATSHAAEKVTVRINNGFQTRAGYTGKGGIWTPSYSVMPCGTDANSHVDIREFTVTVRRGDKLIKTTHRQFTLLRVPPGSYRVHTRLRYAYAGQTSTKTKSQTIRVTRKTDATSVSAGEYKRIRAGMTLATVRSVIGGKGHYESGYLFMDALKFEHSVGISFHKGRVNDKWNLRNVYDWC